MSLDRVSVDASRFRPFGQLGLRARIVASFTLGAAQLGGGGQTLEIVTEVHHAAPDAVSRQVVRSVLAGQATGTYLGRVGVARGANGTDAEQSVRAMLLDRTATANAKPELEIFADDVKCTHGATVGRIDETALFYLKSRGVGATLARQLLMYAFAADILEFHAHRLPFRPLPCPPHQWQRLRRPSPPSPHRSHPPSVAIWSAARSRM